MARASDAHNEIFSNLFAQIAGKLKGQSCRPYGSDKRLHMYILIDSENILIESFFLNSKNNCELQEYNHQHKNLNIKHLNINISIQEIYENVKIKL